MESNLSDLNDVQREAVLHREGPALVVAGAGSGKTRVITRRVAALVESGVPSSAILAITFTNRAAGEMRERVARLLGATQSWISTFHAFGARLLRMEAEAAGLDPGFIILDDADQTAILREILKEIPELRRDARPREVREFISGLKNRAIRPDPQDLDDPMMRAYGAYEERLRACEALDFDDLLLRPALLLEHDERVRRRFAGRFLMLLLDEYQDTNPLQHRIVAQLGSEHGNVFATGDPDQAIYGWRGADVRNILEFERDFPGARVFKLEENYRSTNCILRAASALIRHNQSRIERDLWSRLGEGERVRVEAASSEIEEAMIVLGGIQRAVADGFGLDDVAIFYRTNACSRALEQSLRLANVPYVIIGAVEFYERREVKDLLAYLRATVNPAAEMDLLRILNVPPRKIGTKTIQKLRAEAAASGRMLRDVLLDPAARASLRSNTAQAIEEFAALLGELAAMPRQPVLDVLDRAIERTDYRGYLMRADDPLRDERLENVDELRRAVAEYDERNPGGSLDDFVRETALLRSRDRGEDGTPRVTLMTLHSAKGLEFPVVFVAAVEEGLLPHARAMGSPEEIEEERRLMYVGMTRAQRRLTLTCSRSRTTSSASYGWSPPSRFLREIPPDTTEGASVEPWPAPIDRAGGYEPDVDGDEPPFTVGDVVVHAHFGVGRVLGLNGYGPSAKVTVDFEHAGEKRLVLDYARLRKTRASEA